MRNPWLRIAEFNVIFKHNISRMHETKRDFNDKCLTQSITMEFVTAVGRAIQSVPYNQPGLLWSSNKIHC